MSSSGEVRLPDQGSASIVCPREKSFMTPCVARDGNLALSDDHHCVGCGIGPDQIADEFAAVVRRYVERPRQ